MVYKLCQVGEFIIIYPIHIYVILIISPSNGWFSPPKLKIFPLVPGGAAAVAKASFKVHVVHGPMVSLASV